MRYGHSVCGNMRAVLGCSCLCVCMVLDRSCVNVFILRMLLVPFCGVFFRVCVCVCVCTSTHCGWDMCVGLECSHVSMFVLRILLVSFCCVFGRMFVCVCVLCWIFCVRMFSSYVSCLYLSVVFVRVWVCVCVRCVCEHVCVCGVGVFVCEGVHPTYLAGNFLLCIRSRRRLLLLV